MSFSSIQTIIPLLLSTKVYSFLTIKIESASFKCKRGEGVRNSVENVETQHRDAFGPTPLLCEDDLFTVQNNLKHKAEGKQQIKEET